MAVFSFISLDFGHTSLCYAKFSRVGIIKCLLKVGLIPVFAGEGPKKGVGLINGLRLVGLQVRGREYSVCFALLYYLV